MLPQQLYCLLKVVQVKLCDLLGLVVMTVQRQSQNHEATVGQERGSSLRQPTAKCVEVQDSREGAISCTIESMVHYKHEKSSVLQTERQIVLLLVAVLLIYNPMTITPTK